MPKTHYIATAPNGQVFTRSTESRAYLFCVVGRRCYAHALRFADQTYKVDADNFAYYQGEVGQNPKHGAFHSEEALAEMKRTVSIHVTPENYAKARRAERVARVEANKADGVYDQFVDLGWASRADLATKNASAHMGSRYVDVRILPAVQVAKLPKKGA
jgi:hypothetical protein